MVNGNLNVDSGTISIPANVTVKIYVRGNIDFHNLPINQGGHAAQLQIYGEETNGELRTLQAYGSASICAAFYGPQYDVQLSDAAEWSAVRWPRVRFKCSVAASAGGFHSRRSARRGRQSRSVSRIARHTVEDVRE